MNCVIGALAVRADQVSASNGEYIVEFPAGTRVLSTDWINDDIVIWVAVPRPLPGEPAATLKRRFWILPGLRNVGLHDAATYLGTVFVENQDWHIFIDYSGLPLHREPDAAYPLH